MVHLHGDDTQAVKAFIQLLYGYSCHHLLENAPKDSFFGTVCMRNFASLYVVGQKYLAPNACDAARQVLEAGLLALPEIRSASKIFRQIVSYVYVDYSDEATDLRARLVKYFMENMKGAALDEHFRDLFQEAPDFAFDVTNALLQQRKEMEAIESASAAAKGRKRWGAGGCRERISGQAGPNGRIEANLEGS